MAHRLAGETAAGAAAGSKVEPAEEVDGLQIVKLRSDRHMRAALNGEVPR
jgi:hypothetical protein